MPTTPTADGGVLHTRDQPTVDGELERLATRRAELEALCETDTLRRAGDPAQWRTRDAERRTELAEVEERHRKITDWGRVALEQDEALHGYLVTARPIEARHTAVIKHFAYGLTVGHEKGSTARDLRDWWGAIVKLATALPHTDPTRGDVRNCLVREVNRWALLRSAWVCASMSERSAVEVPFPEYAEHRGASAEMPAWLHIGASRGDRGGAA